MFSTIQFETHAHRRLLALQQHVQPTDVHVVDVRAPARDRWPFDVIVGLSPRWMLAKEAHDATELFAKDRSGERVDVEVRRVVDLMYENEDGRHRPELTGVVDLESLGEMRTEEVVDLGGQSEKNEENGGEE